MGKVSVTDSVDDQLARLRLSLETLQAQRETLGEAVEPAIESLQEKIATLEALQAPAEPTLAEERRVITVFFSDVVGSTALAEKLDPETWREVIAEVHAAAGDTIARHGGEVAQFLGDGLLAFFGAREAAERDPENAVRAAFALQSAVQERIRLPAEVQGEALRLRVGIHTGLVVIGELGSDAHSEFTATGDTVNLAARLQGAAPPGGVLISYDTYRYIRGIFKFIPQPPLTLKGKSQPLRTYLVRGVRPRPFHASARGVAGVETATIGREGEIEQIRNACLAAENELTAVWVQLLGEPGVGKSRLLEDTREWLDLRPEKSILIKARAFEGDEGDPFALIRRLWLDAFQIPEDTSGERMMDIWLHRFQEAQSGESAEPARTLAALLGIFGEQANPSTAGVGDTQALRGRSYVVSRELLLSLLRQAPVHILLEDLHNAGASSWEYLLEVIPALEKGANGLFVLAAARSGWAPPEVLQRYAWEAPEDWELDLAGGVGRSGEAFGAYYQPGSNLRYHQIDLDPLSEGATRLLAEELLGHVEGVPEEVVSLVVERAEGLPYYVEELVNWFLDEGVIDKSVHPWRFVSPRLKQAPLPATLQHLLLTRLTSLPDQDLRCLQCAAIFGRTFWATGVGALSGQPSEAALNRLAAAGFVEKKGETWFAGEEAWDFRQHMMWQTVYESILKRDRHRLHQSAGDWLEGRARRDGRLEEVSAILGEHAEAAGRLGLAADWYLQAADRAWRQGGFEEAYRNYSRALRVLPPVEKGKRWQALNGRIRTTFENEQRAVDINELLSLADEFDDPARKAEALFLSGENRFWMGKFAKSGATLEEALELARQAGDQGLECRILATLAHNNPASDQAARMAQEALEILKEFSDELVSYDFILPLVVYYAQVWDLEKRRWLADRLLAVSQARGNLGGSALGHTIMGAYSLEIGEYKGARREFQQGYEISVQVGARVVRAHALKYLGVVHYRLGDARSARDFLEQAVAEYELQGDVETKGESYLHLALVLEGIENFSGAWEAGTRALQAGEGIGRSALMADARAGLARCALAEGRLEEAFDLAREVWDHLQGEGILMMYYPVLAYLTCAEVFDVKGATEESRLAAEAGHRQLMAIADTIDEPESRKSFMRNISENRELQALWEQMTG